MNKSSKSDTPSTRWKRLDVETALRAVLDGARSLTGAHYSLITTLDAAGRVDDHLVAGLDPGNVERLWQAPGGPAFFAYLNALPGPVRQTPGGQN